MLQITETHTHTTFVILAPMSVDINFQMDYDETELYEFLDLLESHGIDDVKFSQDITNKGYVRNIQLTVANKLLTQAFEYDLLNHLVKYGPKKAQ